MKGPVLFAMKNSNFMRSMRFDFILVLAVVLSGGCQELLPSEEATIVKDLKKLGSRVLYSYAVGDYDFDGAKKFQKPVGVSCTNEEQLDFVCENMERLPQLSKLQLMNMSVTPELLARISEAGFLTLRFNRCSFSGPDGSSETSKAVGIKSLHLAGTVEGDIENAFSMIDFKEMRILVLDGSFPSTDVVASVSDMDNLRILSLRLSETAEAFVFNLKSESLRVLDLSDSAIKLQERDLERIPSLEYLNVRGTAFSAQDVAAISLANKKLKSVFVDRNIEATVKELCPNLKVEASDMFFFGLTSEDLVEPIRE